MKKIKLNVKYFLSKYKNSKKNLPAFIVIFYGTYFTVTHRVTHQVLEFT